MICNLYRVIVKHDNGTTMLQLPASSEQNAKDLICHAENCPESAIKKIELIKCIYNSEVK